MGLRVVTPPGQEPVTLEAVKRYVREYNDGMDVLITELIPMMRQQCEDFQNRAYLEQTLELSLDTVQSEIVLPRPPLKSLVSVVFYDVNNTATTMSNSAFTVDTISQPGRIVLNDGQSWPEQTARAANAVVVRYVAGENNPAALDGPVKLAIIAAVHNALDNPTEPDLPESVRSMLHRNRVVPI